MIERDKTETLHLVTNSSPSQQGAKPQQEHSLACPPHVGCEEDATSSLICSRCAGGSAMAASSSSSPMHPASSANAPCTGPLTSARLSPSAVSSGGTTCRCTSCGREACSAPRKPCSRSSRTALLRTLGEAASACM